MLVILYLAGRDLSKADDQWDSWRVIVENWCIVRAQLKLAKVGMISSRVILILSKTRPLMPNSNWHLLNNSTWVARLLFVFIQFGSSSIHIKKCHKSSQVCQGRGWIYVYALLPWPQKLTMATFLYHIGLKIPSFLLHLERNWASFYSCSL